LNEATFYLSYIHRWVHGHSTIEQYVRSKSVNTCTVIKYDAISNANILRNSLEMSLLTRAMKN
jgi:hypothetical protein